MRQEDPDETEGPNLEDSHPPSILYRCGTCPVTETFVKKISAYEMRMLRYCLGVSWEKHRINEDIRKEARVAGIVGMMRRKRVVRY